VDAERAKIMVTLARAIESVKLKKHHPALVAIPSGAFDRLNQLTKPNEFANLKVQHPVLAQASAGLFVRIKECKY
jgi:hypothetical protein